MISHTWLPTRDVVCIQYHKWTRRKIQGLPTGLSSNLMSHCLKFTAVNIPGRQLSLTWPVPIITTGLVHSLARENAKWDGQQFYWLVPLLVRWSGLHQHQSCGMWEKTSQVISAHYFYRGDGCKIAWRQVQDGNTFLRETLSLGDSHTGGHVVSGHILDVKRLHSFSFDHQPLCRMSTSEMASFQQ